jgi:putative tryptophan/tyrosine transport system substrate-binding protein
MNRRAFVRTFAGGLLAARLAAEAQQPGKVYRIGNLLLQSPEEVKTWTHAFEKSLRDLGYVEGRNLLIEHRSAGGRPERLADLAVELVGLGVDLIVANSNPTIVAAKQATATIPIVMVYAVDPVGTGFIASLRQPGGNITGGAWDPSPELYAKNVEVLRTINPKLSRVALVSNPNFKGAGPYLKATEDASRQLGLTLQTHQVRERSDFESAFASIGKERAEAVVVFGDPLAFLHRRVISELAARYRLPAISPFREFADAGGLLSYGPDLTDYWRRAAIYVDKILKGAKPGALPVEQPTKFELIINLKTAKALGLTIPPSLLQRADQVIE